MPKLQIAVPHKLPEAEAKRRIEHLIADMKTRFGDQVTEVQESWNGNNGTFSFKAMGFSVSGTGHIAPEEVHLELDLPFAVWLMKARIEEEITRHAREVLA